MQSFLKRLWQNRGAFALGAALAAFATWMPVAHAQNIVTSSGVWYRSGTSMLLNPSTLNVGSSATRIAKIWATDLDVSGVFTFGGSMSGSLDLNGNDLIFDADADSIMSAAVDDTILIELNGASDFQFEPNNFTALSGSALSTNTINETTAASGVTIDGVLVKDSGINGTVGAITPAAGTFTTLSSSDAHSWSAGTAVTAGAYSIQRNNDATNRLQLNVPSSALIEFSVNDTAAVTVNSNGVNANIGATTAGTGSFTTVSQTGLSTWTAGSAITAGSYQIGRNNDATNRQQYNVPTGTIHEFSINDSGVFFVSAGAISVSGGLYNASAGNNAGILPATTGTTINRNIADSNIALIVDQVNASSTGDITEFRFGSAAKHSIDVNGGTIFDGAGAAVAGNYEIRRNNDATNRLQFNIPTSALGEFSVNDVFVAGWSSSGILTSEVFNPTSSNNSRISLATTGSTISRNVADASVALIVQQTHASSTGDIVNFNNNAGTMFSVGQAGALTARGLLTNTVSGNTVRLINNTDSNSVQVARLEGDRASMANGDEAYESLMLSDSAGTQTEFARIGWVATTVTDASEAGRLDFSVMTAGSLVGEMQLDGAALSPYADGGIALGTTSFGYNGLHLNTGTAINWDGSDVTVTHAANLLTMAGGDLTLTDNILTLNKASAGIAFDVNDTATTYTTGVGIVDVARTGAITGVGNETIFDLNVKPSYTLTEPATDTVQYYAGNFDLSSVSVTAGADNSVLAAMHLVAPSDADAQANMGLFVDSGKTRLDGGGTNMQLDGSGSLLEMQTNTVTENNPSETIAIGAAVSLGVTTYVNGTASLTITDPTSMYIAGVPVASTNVIFTNAATSLWVDSGPVRFDGDILMPTSGTAINFGSGDVTGTYTANTLTFAGASSGYVFNDGIVNASSASVRVKTSSANVSAPPTDAELDSAFGDPTTLGSGFKAILDDNGDGVTVYTVWTTGNAGEWYYTLGTLAL